jgi:hypothetical protein
MAPPAVGSGGLFVDHKKGEIPELKNLLRDSAIDKDPKAKRAVMERVVGYMTLGSVACCVLVALVFLKFLLPHAQAECAPLSQLCGVS